jgi:hypothetical protein
MAEPLPLTEPEKAALRLLAQNVANTRIQHQAAFEAIAAAEGMLQGGLKTVVLLRGLDGDWDLREDMLVKKEK